MKNIIKLLILITIFSSCNKEQLNIENAKTIDIEDNLEAKEIYTNYINSDYRLGIIYDNNFGEKVRLKANGDSPLDLVCIIDQFEIKHTRENGVVFIENDNYQELYGKLVNLKIKDDLKNESFEFYAPKVIKFNKLSSYPNKNIPKIGNTLQWEPDTKSVGVLLDYVVYDKDQFTSNNAKILDSGKILIKDDGNYNIDYILKYNNAKSVEISLKRANGVSFTDKNGKKLFFSVQSIDSHYYVIE